MKEALRHHAIPQRAVAAEITGTQIIPHLDEVMNFIPAPKPRGGEFLFDDVSSGMASFGDLKPLTVDCLEIDGVFVEDIVSDPIDRSMVECMNEVVQGIGSKIDAKYARTTRFFVRSPSPVWTWPGDSALRDRGRSRQRSVAVRPRVADKARPAWSVV